jgi:hypothetical protein
MKVQKIISLTPTTAKLATEHENFSEFVRECLLHGPKYKEINREVILRIRWKRAADLLAQTILDIYKELDQEHNETVESLTNKAFGQARLEDFE